MATTDPRPPGRKSNFPLIVVSIWAVVMTIVAVCGVLSPWSAFTTQVDLPYTAFLSQLHANNIASVRLSGAEITGDFVRPFHLTESTDGRSQKPKSLTVLTAEFPELLSPTHKSFTGFRTTFPEEIGDPNLLAQLMAHHVQLQAAGGEGHWEFELLAILVPGIVLTGLFWWMARRTGEGQPSLSGLGRTQARKISGEQTRVRFTDIAGVGQAKEDLQEEVDFLRHAEKYHANGARIPRGILLVGPPGTGKTLLARAVAGEAGVPFYQLSGSEFVEIYVGVGASRVRDLFAQAKEAAPAIVFIDELDAVGRRRGGGTGGGDSEREQTLNQLLVEMDGFDERQNVVVLAATNRPDVLDPALLRPGRFDRRIAVGLPDRVEREEILRIHTRRLRLDRGIALAQLARTTTGLSGAELANLCNEAALIATRHDLDRVTSAAFDEAQDKVVFGGARPLSLCSHERRVVAYHESGHALVAWLSPAADPVNKVTIVPHGRALGLTEQLPIEDRYQYSRSYLMARLTVMLGGRTAEEIALGEITTGAVDDLVQATRLARHMVVNWGMGKVGWVAFDTEEAHASGEIAQEAGYSQATAARIDREVEALLEDRHRAAHNLLIRAREKLDGLVKALLREETLHRDTLEKIIGAHPMPVNEAI